MLIDSHACVSEETYLFAHDRLLDRRQVLQRAQEQVRVLRTAEVLGKVRIKLLGEREQHLVLVVKRLVQEGDQLVPRTLGTQRQRNRRDAVNRVQAKCDIV